MHETPSQPNDGSGETSKTFTEAPKMFTETPKIFTETRKIFTEIFTENPTIGNTENSQKEKCLKFFTTSPSKPYFAGRRRLPASAARHDDILLLTRRPAAGSARAGPGPPGPARQWTGAEGSGPRGIPTPLQRSSQARDSTRPAGLVRDAATVAGP